MLDDPDLKEIAQEEITNLEVRVDELYHKLELLLVPKDENDGKNVIMEIRGAAGEMKETSLLVIYFGCILIMLKKIVGKSKLFIVSKVPLEVIHILNV